MEGEGGSVLSMLGDTKERKRNKNTKIKMKVKRLSGTFPVPRKWRH
jgi:hypothetical protein